MTSFEIGPPGLVGVGRFVLMWLFFSTFVIPFAVLGLFAAIAFDDFGLSVRIAGGVLGALGALGVVVPILWALVRGWFWRERVQISTGGVVVRAGFPRGAKARAARAASFTLETAERSAVPLRARVVGSRFLRLRAGALDVYLGGGLAPGEQDRLRDELAAARTRTPVDPAVEPTEWRYPMTWGIVSGGQELARDLVAPLRRPLPFLLCDLVALSASAVVGPLLELIEDPAGLYPAFYALFLAGLWLRRFDPSYLAGLAAYRKRWFSFPLLLVMLGLVTALAAGVMALPHTHVAVALGAPMIAAIAVHRSLLKISARATDARSPSHNWWLEMVCAASLAPILVLHEHATFRFFDGTSDLFVFALPLVPPVVAFVYLPIRIHYFIDDPGNRSNAIWFTITVAALTAKAVFG